MNVIKLNSLNKADLILKKFIDIYLEKDILQEAKMRTLLEIEIFDYLLSKYPDFKRKQTIR